MVLPQLKESPEKLYRICYASVQSNLLLTAVKLRIFNHLTTPMTAGQVAGAIQGHERNTGLFLNGLAACGLVKKQQGRYWNTPLAESFLIHGTPADLGPGFLHQAETSGLMARDLSGLVLEGPKTACRENTAGDEALWARSAQWMANHERAGVAQQMAGIVAGLPGFAGFETMLDLGGGPGMFGIAMVSSHPAMTGVVYDREPVAAVADRFIREYGMADRIRAMAGDYNRDPIGQGYDFIWSSATLNFARDNLDAVMEKIFQALNPGGIFANLSEGMTHEGTRPGFYVLCTLMWAMAGGILPFERGEIAGAMTKAGFRSVESNTLETGWGPMDLDIARKGANVS